MEYRLQVVNDHTPDETQILFDGAGSVGGEYGVRYASDRVISRYRFIREDVDSRPDLAAPKHVSQGGEVDHVGATNENKDGSGPH